MFYYSLAHELGYASVELMLAEVSSVEITEWQAYFRIQADEHHKEQVKAEANARARGR